jgi:hypothetical protein
VRTVSKIIYLLFIVVTIVAMATILGTTIGSEILSESVSLTHKIIMSIFVTCGIFFMGVGSGAMYNELFGKKK